MSLVRLLGFQTLTCGCVAGRYREIGLDREVQYIEEKAPSCLDLQHQRNQPIRAGRAPRGFDARHAS